MASADTEARGKQAEWVSCPCVFRRPPWLLMAQGHLAKLQGLAATPHETGAKSLTSGEAGPGAGALFSARLPPQPRKLLPGPGCASAEAGRLRLAWGWGSSSVPIFSCLEQKPFPYGFRKGLYYCFKKTFSILAL